MRDTIVNCELQVELPPPLPRQATLRVPIWEADL